MNLQKAIKNYQTTGRKKTMDALTAAEKEIKINKLVVSVLSAVSEFKELIKTKEFKKHNVAKMLLQLDTGNSFRFKYANANGELFKHEEYQFTNYIYQQMEYILGRVEVEIKMERDIDLKQELDPNHSHEQMVDLTPEGLKTLQAFLLGPTLQIEVEKALLTEAVSPIDVNKKPGPLKI